MSTMPCSRHRAKIVGKLASFYWAWFDADGKRHAYKELMCSDCVVDELKELLVNADSSPANITACPACGIDSHDDLDPIYASVYLPKQDVREYSLTTCPSCAAKVRIRILQGGTPLADRQGIDGGPRPPTSNPWVALLP